MARPPRGRRGGRDHTPGPPAALGIRPGTRRGRRQLAGLPLAAVTPALQALELRRFREGDGRTLFDLPDDPLPDAGTSAPVRSLPTWDATLLVHCRRTQVLPERHRPSVSATRIPHSVPVFLVDGAVAGSWRHERGAVTVRPFEPLAPAIVADVEEAAGALAAFHGEDEA